jgi:nucleoside 2-deoxyribosyltransferase
MDLEEIKSVTICSSSKFYETARQLAAKLRSGGVVVHTPHFDFNEELVEVSREKKAELTHEFLKKIHESDAIYVVDQHGYTGPSVCIEVGFASALGKQVILSEPARDGAVAALANAIIGVDTFPAALRR